MKAAVGCVVVTARIWPTVKATGRTIAWVAVVVFFDNYRPRSNWWWGRGNWWLALHGVDHGVAHALALHGDEIISGWSLSYSVGANVCGDHIVSQSSACHGDDLWDGYSAGQSLSKSLLNDGIVLRDLCVDAAAERATGQGTDRGTDCRAGQRFVVVLTNGSANASASQSSDQSTSVAMYGRRLATRG